MDKRLYFAAKKKAESGGYCMLITVALGVNLAYAFDDFGSYEQVYAYTTKKEAKRKLAEWAPDLWGDKES